MTAIRRRDPLSLLVSAPGGLDAATEPALASTGPVPAGPPAAPAVAAPPCRTGPDTGDLSADVAALVRLVSGAPVATPASDLIAFANGDWAGLDPARDPNGYTLAEVTLAWFLSCSRGTGARPRGQSPTSERPGGRGAVCTASWTWSDRVGQVGQDHRPGAAWSALPRGGVRVPRLPAGCGKECVAVGCAS
jgi:hypothetical protein